MAWRRTGEQPRRVATAHSTSRRAAQFSMRGDVTLALARPGRRRDCVVNRPAKFFGCTSAMCRSGRKTPVARACDPEPRDRRAVPARLEWPAPTHRPGAGSCAAVPLSLHEDPT
jgi:hypothetical protein